ncbi:recombinase family protein [Sorangium sp. So ce1128]
MRAAIYARRSTEEHQAESLDTQIDGAQRFVASRGWTLDPAHVFVDSGVSRAEFVRRPGLIALLRSAEARSFDVVVCRDETRLGGDTFRTGQLVATLTEQAQLWYYFTGERVEVTDAISKFMIAARSFSAEIEREKVSQRTRENLERKARRGLVAGGVVYGYRNEPAPGGAGKIRVIDEPQAAVVREIFTRYAAGQGLRTIAKDLNARGVPPPRTGRRGIGSWSPGAIHAMLHRPLYVGRVEWGRTHKAYKGGTKTRTDQHSHEIVAVDAPHLRIVPPELWDADAARCNRGVRGSRQEGAGRPASYLLSGILRCGLCSGPLTVINGKASYEPIKVYACCRRRDRGATACSSTLRRPVDAVDTVILDWVRREVLTEAVVSAVLTEVRRRVAERTETSRAEVEQLDRQAQQLRREVDRFAELSLEAPPDVRQVLYGKLAERQRELSAVEDRLRALRTVPGAVDLEIRRLEREARARVEELVTATRRNPVEGRAFLRALFPEGLATAAVDTPDGIRMRIEGTAVPGLALGLELDGNSASPAGFEPA